ncbi:hypothetical protein QEZ48_21120 [Aquamicrobium lusatiense]|uniref:hypothetical protein n=1 Tax=Aquamicrobium lusatiense TaxID=89772 RepID=UPI0024544893|nr:hypothetical protein [Aquamicrobium lusatiense]MDH4993315.1 hypothetical protein [Aquamicrobium lusatiense]
MTAHIKPVVAYPAIKQLARSDWRAALAIYREVLQAGPSVLHHDDLAEAQQGDDAPIVEVPPSAVTYETMSERHHAAATNEGAYSEHRFCDRPSERQLLENIGWIEWPTTRKNRNEPIGWAMRCACGRIAPAEGALFHPVRDQHQARLGGLTFNIVPGLRRAADGGQLVSFRDGKGKQQRPVTGSTERGASRRRSVASARAYLARPAAIASIHAAEPYQRPYQTALPPMYDPLPGVEEARAELAALMAAYTGPIKKCPPAIAKSAHFFGGISSGSETKKTPAPIWEVPERRGLNHILEEVAAGGDFSDVGRAAGYAGKFTSNASHRGKVVLLREAARIIEQAAKDGKPLPMEPTAEQQAVLDVWRGKEGKRAAEVKMLRAANDNTPTQQRRVA